MKDEVHRVESKLLTKIKKLNISILVLKSIREVLEINKIVKDLCILKGGIKKKIFPTTILMYGKLIDLLSRKLVNPKYGDLGSPILIIFIGLTKI